MISRPVQITIFLLLVSVLAGGIYMNLLKQREDRREATRSNATPLAPPIAGPAENVRLMIAYDDDGVLKEESTSMTLPKEPASRAKQVLRALIGEYAQKPSPHPLADGAGVKDVFMVEGGLCVVDLNPAFAEGHRSGVMVEEMTIASMVESLAMNVPGIKRVKFLVDGKERETLAGHADLGMIYDVPAVDRLATELQAQ
jgi:hypothetical protein